MKFNTYWPKCHCQRFLWYQNKLVKICIGLSKRFNYYLLQNSSMEKMTKLNYLKVSLLTKFNHISGMLFRYKRCYNGYIFEKLKLYLSIECTKWLWGWRTINLLCIPVWKVASIHSYRILTERYTPRSPLIFRLFWVYWKPIRNIKSMSWCKTAVTPIALSRKNIHMTINQITTSLNVCAIITSLTVVLVMSQIC